MVDDTQAQEGYQHLLVRKEAAFISVDVSPGCGSAE